MNNKKSNSNISLLLAVSGLVVILLMVLNILSVNKINNISGQIKTEKAQLDQNKATLSELKKLEQYRPELENANEFLEKQIPDEPLEHELIEYIQNLTVKNKNVFVEIKFEERKENGNLFEMPFQLTVNGKYSSLLGLLDNIDKGERLIRIDDIIFISMGNADGLVNTTIMAKAFYK
ncbi:MAG: type 4a pilus biogenesis protein PilO [Acetivibrionales bacterium]|jgi:Tfp pilus assembly protein PilO